MSKKDERKELHEEHEAVEALRCICRELTRIGDLLEQFLFPAANGFLISQSGGSMAITGIVLGATGTFTETPTPAGGALQAGNITVWTSDDPNTSLTASADGTSVAVATSATDTATSFNLTVSGVNSAGAAISSSVNVPLLPAAVAPATGFAINQTS